MPNVRRRPGEVSAHIVEQKTIIHTSDGEVTAEKGQIIVKDVEGLEKVYSPFSFLLRYSSTDQKESKEFIEKIKDNVEPYRIDAKEWIKHALWIAYCLNPDCDFYRRGLGHKDRCPCSVAHPCMYHNAKEGHFVDRLSVDVSPSWGQQPLTDSTEY